jgi:hypothetical protein
MKGCFNCGRKHDCPNEPEECEDCNWSHWIPESQTINKIEEVHDPEVTFDLSAYDNVSEIIKPHMKGRKERIDGMAPKNHEQENKPQMSLIPLDIERDYTEPAYREGLIKYHRESWRKGFLATVMMDALQRHITKWFYEGEEYDPDAEKLGVKKHHLGGAKFCLNCLCDMLKNHPELDDRPCKLLQETKNDTD